MIDCPFCQRVAESNTSYEHGEAVAFPDAFASSPGHFLVVPRIHVEDLFELPVSVISDIWMLLAQRRDEVSAAMKPAGFNVGLNAGRAAGQTVEHAHVHLIPRYLGDVPDPRGGVRWVLPATAVYWDQS